MIKNSNEYKLTTSIINQFGERKEFLRNLEPSDEITFEIDGLDAISNDLKQQIQQYDEAKNNETKLNKIEFLEDIPRVFIGRRIQLDLLQYQLAEMLGIDSEEYIRLENEEFFGLTPELFTKILSILNVNNPNHIMKKNYEQILPTIQVNLKKLNFSKAFLSSFMPITIEQVIDYYQKQLKSASYLTEKFLEAFKKIFSINLEEDISISKYQSKLAVAFKRKINVNEENLSYTTSYAAYVLNIIANQMHTSIKFKADPITIREIILEKHGSVNIETCLDFIWSLNIAVTPLSFHSSFHGACFDFDGTKIIALSQQNLSVSRWKFDMLHELYHALTMNYSAYIERTEIMDQDDEEEKLASEFACFVIFGQEMDSYLKLVLEKSDGIVERIKSNVISVAKAYGIDIDDFSNYVAYRISKRPINFWGAASNLQKDKRNPADILRNYLYSHLDVVKIDAFKLIVLQKAFSQEVF